MTTTPDPSARETATDAGSTPGPATPVDPAPPVSQQDPPKKASKDAGPGKKPASDPLRGSRTSGAYVALIAFALVLVLLIIFIAQNTQSASVRFLGWEGSAPVAVLLLIATAAGLLLAGVAATSRILQLRRRVKKERKR